MTTPTPKPGEKCVVWFQDTTNRPFPLIATWRDGGLEPHWEIGWKYAAPHEVTHFVPLSDCRAATVMREALTRNIEAMDETLAILRGECRSLLEVESGGKPLEQWITDASNLAREALAACRKEEA